MALAQLIYISRAAQKMPLDTVQTLVDRSESNNATKGITGGLMCVGEHFMQLLEGELADIIELYEKIRLDKRHVDVRCLIAKNVAKRLFPQWGMRLLDTESRVKLDRSRLERLIEDFRLHRNTGHHGVEARVLLQDFKQQLLDAA